MEISEKWPVNPGHSAAQCFLPFVIIVGVFAFLTGFFHLLAGENPVGPVTLFVSASWDELGPLVLFLAVVWLFHLVSHLLVRSFAKDVRVVTRAVQRVVVAFWRRFSRVPTGLALIHGTPPLSLVRLFFRSQPPWLAAGWRPGDSVQLE